MKNFAETLRKICTYHSDGGTSGYNLSEEQFQQVVALHEKVQAKAVKDVSVKNLHCLGCNGEFCEGATIEVLSKQK